LHDELVATQQIVLYGMNSDIKKMTLPATTPPLLSNEQVLFILEKASGVAPYSHEFVPGGLDPQLISGFISAMTSFVSNLAGSEQTHWKTEYGEDVVFLVEMGERYAGVLAITRETNEARSKLRRIVREYEGSFDFTSTKSGRNLKQEAEFDKFVRRTMILDRLTENSIILKPSDYKNKMQRVSEIKNTAELARFLENINTGETLAGVAKSQNVKIDAAAESVALALWMNLIQVVYVPSSEDILSLSEGSLTLLLHRNNPMGISSNTIRAVGSFDGRSPLSTYLRNLRPKEIRRTLLELGNLLNSGYVQRISIEQRLVLVNECILNNQLRLGESVLGGSSVRGFLEVAISNGVELHPWVSRIRVSEKMVVHCELNDSMSTIDLDDMYEALEYLILVVTEQMQKKSDFDYIQSASNTARKRCNERWGAYIRDSVV
jgi:hypothetical protein